MIWIIGFKTINKKLWVGLGTCRRCLKRALHELRLETEWGTFFFVPIAPLRRQRLLICSNCGLSTSLTRPEAEQLMAEMPNLLHSEH